MSDDTPTRPLLRYHGGKWSIAKWIVSLFPPHRIYVEPFGGGGSVLLSKPRSRAEIYNDLDAEMGNLFRVVRDRGDELVRAIELTPYSRAEFDESYEPSTDSVEQARRTLVRAQFGFGGNLMRMNADGRPQRTGFRCYTGNNRSGNYAREWRTMPDGLSVIVERMRGVIIETRDAVEVMKSHDAVDALHYVDPPYVHHTRSSYVNGTKRGYRHEMDDAQHVILLDYLSTTMGAVILSGYDCDLYAEKLAGWERRERPTHADGGRPRIEVLWMRNVRNDLFS